jgi:hypothetical protein
MLLATSWLSGRSAVDRSDQHALELAATATALPTPPAPNTAAVDCAADSAPDSPACASRAQALEMLREVNASAERLRPMAPERWAGNAYIDGLSAFEAAQKAILNGEFNTALSDLENAKTLLMGVEASAAGVALQAGMDGWNKLDAGNPEIAVEMFDLALLIQPDNAGASSGRKRALVYEQVRTLESASQRQLQSGKPVEAEKLLRQAAELDGADQAIQSSLAAVTAAVREDKLAAATKSGYQALEQRSYRSAADYFAQALAIDPQSAAAREGQKLALAEYSVEQRQSYETQSAEAIAQGRWAEGISSAEAALRLDPAASAARASLQRASRGQQIEASLDQVLSAPGRLSDAGAYKNAQVVAQTARSGGDLGPQVPTKIAALETLLTNMATPQKLDVISDSKTSVTVERVGSLGKIEKVSIELKPGKYVLRGSRQGYRDVRMEIDITPDSPRNSYAIICDERLP